MLIPALLGVEKKYLIAKVAGISSQLPGSCSSENRLYAITRGVHSLLWSWVTRSGPSDKKNKAKKQKTISWSDTLLFTVFWGAGADFPTLARKWIGIEQLYVLFQKSAFSSHWGNLQCKSKGQADWVSAGAFQDSRGYYILPSLDCGKVRWSSTSEPSTTQRDHRKILINFMKFSQLFYLTLLCWRVALTDYRCKTIHSALAVRQLGSQFVSGDTYVTFLLNSFYF